jgi:hypothetical protein
VSICGIFSRLTALANEAVESPTPSLLTDGDRSKPSCLSSCTRASVS